MVFLGAMDAQALLGLILFFVLSPLMKSSFADMANTMNDAVARFWTVEHPALMLAAVFVPHVGGALRGRRQGPQQHRVTAMAQLLWLVLTLLAIPWPGLARGRELFRLL